MSSSTLIHQFDCNKFGAVTFHPERDPETGKVVRDPISNEISCLATASRPLSKADRHLLNGAAIDIEHVFGIERSTATDSPSFTLIINGTVSDDDLPGKFELLMERVDTRHAMLSQPNFFEDGMASHSEVGMFHHYSV